ncbi:MAG: GNAT family N-acetyltransferase [Candidatus Thorarchaeota archaeon]
MNELEVIQFQEISSNAWPAMNFILLNGWTIRVGDGYTRRANSVLPVKYCGTDIHMDILSVENLYQKFNLPSIFQIPDYCEPTNLKQLLLDRGYEEHDESLLMSQEISHLYSIEENNSYEYSIDVGSSDEWFINFGRLTNRTHDKMIKNQNIVNRIPFQKAFAFARNDNEIVGLGLGVLERNFIGIYDMIVSSDYRRQGIGQSLIFYLIEWGKSHGATIAYLQVQGDNSGAIALYKKIGFIDRYHYRYLIKNNK